MNYIIDRIIEDIALCEDEHMNKIKIPLSQLPANVKEGDCIKKTTDGIYEIDHNALLRRKQLINQKLNTLFKK